MAVVLPVLLMLLFVYVFGGAIETGTEYVNYVVPGIILLCTGYGAASTAVDVASDMTEGIIDRFRSLPILSSAVLTGHVVASLARNAFSTALVVGVAWLSGLPAERRRRSSGCAVAGVLLLFVLAHVLAGGRRSGCSPAASRRPAASPSSCSSCRTCPARSCRPDTMPAVLRAIADAPAGHPDHRDRCAGCCSAPRSGPAAGSRWPGAAACWSPRTRSSATLFRRRTAR